MEDITPNCPPPLISLKNKLYEKNYVFNFDNGEYELIISLYDDESNNKEKIFNFKLKNRQNTNENESNIYYECNQYASQLINLFLINIHKVEDPIETIFGKIDNFHENNNFSIQKNNNEDKLDLIYIVKTIDNDDIELYIELNKKQAIVNERNDIKLLEEISYLKNSLKRMEEKFKKQNEQIQLLTNSLNNLTNNFNKNNKKKIITEEKQLLFKSNLSNYNNYKIISSQIDGGRGVNDLFEVYHLYNDKKTVYVAMKKKGYNDISFIDIIKIISLYDYKNIISLKGHQKRINFIKYFLNPYNKKEYLISGDREERVRVWEIKDENNYISSIYIKTNYGRLILQQSIYNCILYFTEYKSYIYTTTVTDKCSRLYDLEDGALLREISITSNNYTFYLIRYKDYIVDVCRDYVIIYALFNEEIYDKIQLKETEGDNRSACIIYNKNNTDYLYISNSQGYIIPYDLKKKKVGEIISLNKDLYHIIPWNLDKLIVAQYNTQFLGIVNLDNSDKKYKDPKNKNQIKCNKEIICVKKILLNEKDEILLAAGEYNNDLLLLFPDIPNSSENKDQNINKKIVNQNNNNNVKKIKDNNNADNKNIIINNNNSDKKINDNKVNQNNNNVENKNIDINKSNVNMINNNNDNNKIIENNKNDNKISDNNSKNNDIMANKNNINNNDNKINQNNDGNNKKNE